MKVINPKKDFGGKFYEVGDEDFVEMIVNRIDIEGNHEIELNLQNCIINYPATSKILDQILFQLKRLKGKKELTVKVMLFDEPVHLLNGLFFGSKFLNIQEDSQLLSLDNMNNTIKEMIEDKNIKISVILVNKTGKILDYYYGN